MDSMDRPTRFLTHYGVKGMKWDQRKVKVSEAKIDNVTNAKEYGIRFDAKSKQLAVLQLIELSKKQLNDTTVYSEKELTDLMAEADAKVKKDNSVENIVNATFIELRLRMDYPKAFEEYKDTMREKVFTRESLDKIKASKNPIR